MIKTTISVEKIEKDTFWVVEQHTDSKGNILSRKRLLSFGDSQSAVFYIRENCKVKTPNQKFVIDWVDGNNDIKQTWTILEYGQKTKYSVRLYYTTYVDIDVEADNEEDAIEEAYNEIDKNGADFLANLVQAEEDPYVEEI